MKTLAIGLLVFLTSSLSIANTTPDNEALTPDPYAVTHYAVDVSTNYLQIPYTKHYEIPMMFLAQRGEYILYRCESCLLLNVPSCPLKGGIYHYFVYKNGKFHLSVNECNQNAVYSFFTNSEPETHAYLSDFSE